MHCSLLMNKVCILPRRQWQVMDEIEAEFKDPSLHLYQRWHFITGRKST
jgi:hypothetical protein